MNPTPSEAGPPTLGAFLRSERAHILDEWQRQVGRLPPARGLTQPQLLDHLPTLFDRIVGMVEDLEAGRPVGEPGRSSELHAIERLDEGYDLEHVVHEFAALRQAVLRLWAQQATRSSSQPLLNLAIDEAVSTAVSRYAAARERAAIALDRIAATTMDSLDLGSLLRALTGVLLETTASVDSVAIYLREGASLRLRAAVGIEEHLVDVTTVEIGSHTCEGRIAATSEPLEMRNAAADPLVTSPLRTARARAFYGVPLRHGGRLIGVSHICSRTAFEFSREDKVLFRSMAERATVGIVHWQVLESLRESEDRFHTLADNIAQLAWMADETGSIFWYNRRWFDFTGTTLEQVGGWGWRQVHHPEHLERVEQKFRRHLASGERWEDTFPLRGKDGRFRWFLSRAVPIHDESTGRIVQWLGTNTDITEQKIAEEERAAAVERERIAREQSERSAAMLDALFVGAPIGLAFFDEQDRYIRINETAAALDGRPAREHIGKTLRQMLGDEADRIEPLLRKAWDNGDGVSGIEMSGAPHPTADDVREWQVSVFPAKLPDSTQVGVGMAVAEITALKRALQARDEFLSIASHDLKSPLSSIRLLVDLIVRRTRAGLDRVDWPWMVRKLEKVQHHVTRVASLLDNLLDVSRIHSGRINLDLEDVDLATLVRDVTTRHLEMLASGGSELRLDAPAHVVGRWDALRLEQIVTNLLSNAVKYGAGRPVEVHLASSASHARLAVRDHGVGIAPADRERLFRRFERVGDPRAIAGTGVGLWIVKSFVEAMGGSITVESTPGEGSLFAIELPRAPPGAS